MADLAHPADLLLDMHQQSGRLEVALDRIFFAHRGMIIKHDKLTLDIHGIADDAEIQSLGVDVVPHQDPLDRAV